MPQFSRFASKNSLTVSKRRRGILAAVYKFQGTVSGYVSGGIPNTSLIEKFSFASGGSSASIGNLTRPGSYFAGQSSNASGYTSGGTLPVTVTNVIDKFPFASDANATDVGDLTGTKRDLSGQSSAENGYTGGGGPSVTNVIDKFPFASDANATDVGDLTQTRRNVTGQSSDASGYVSAGGGPPGTNSLNTIDKFSFASDANATDVGDLSQPRHMPAGQSSDVSGYTSGGRQSPSSSPPFRNTIDKFPFASDANATDVGDLSQPRQSPAGQSSTAHGYSAGGLRPTGPNTSSRTDVIDRFPFASNINASGVKVLTASKYASAGQQV